MNLDDFRAILENTGVDIWGFIDTAIKVATLDYSDELSVHRDGIVAKLYSICPDCDPKRRIRSRTPVDDNGFVSNNAAVEAVYGDDEEGQNKEDSPYIPVSIGGDEGDVREDEDHHENQQEGRFFDDDDRFDEQRRIISIKEQMEDPHQTEDSLIDLLQTLAGMEVTFKALQETDIGRHVNRLRKHPSNDVRSLVKMLVRKWKDLVDDWVVMSNTPGVQYSSNVIASGDEDSPLQNVSKNRHNDHHNQIPDFGYSTNPHNGISSSVKSEPKPKADPAYAPRQRRDPPAKPVRSASPASAPPPNRQKEVAIDPARLASARKRLQENYQEAQNAKKQRTIQVMDIHEIPKPKNSFFGRSKGRVQRH